jgi:ubiquinone/menaquinone biosynthesis C-methylase UbiE
MSEKYNLQQIFEFWTQQATSHQQSPSASWSDHSVIDMEIRAISEYLADGDKVLDVGCANGYSSINFARDKQIKLRGLDYIPQMIEYANLHLSKVANLLAGQAEFAVGDITQLAEPDNAYDKVVVIRVVINLGTWENQLKGLRECIRVLKPGGVLLLSEATIQGWQNLNHFRREWKLSEIPMPPFNTYLDQDKMIEALSSDLQLVELVNFASTYYVGTRILKPLLIQALGVEIDAANPSMEWNRWFSMLPAAGDYGTQKLFVFRKLTN